MNNYFTSRNGSYVNMGNACILWHDSCQDVSYNTWRFRAYNNQVPLMRARGYRVIFWFSVVDI